MSAQDTKADQEEYENLAAFRADYDCECEVCGSTPVVAAVGLCGPCTWGEADTMDGSWWSEKDENRFAELHAIYGPSVHMAGEAI